MRQRINISEESNQRILWYENHHINYEVMKSYYPKFYDRIKEMQAILFAEGYMLDEVEMATEIILNNMFIVHMDESSVSALERFLSITPLSYQTLDDRKNVLLSHFRGNGSVSMSSLESIVETIAKGDCEGELKDVDKDGNRGISFHIMNSDIRDSLNDVISAIMRHIPAHLWFEIVYEPAIIARGAKAYTQVSQSNNTIISTGGTRVEKASGASKAYAQISQSFNDVIVAEMVVFDGGGLTDNIEDIIDGGGLSDASDNILDFNY